MVYAMPVKIYYEQMYGEILTDEQTMKYHQPLNLEMNKGYDD